LTVIHSTPEGDALFPRLPAGDFGLVSARYRESDAKNSFGMTFLTLKR